MNKKSQRRKVAKELKVTKLSLPLRYRMAKAMVNGDNMDDAFRRMGFEAVSASMQCDDFRKDGNGSFCTKEPERFDTDRAFEDWLDRIYYPGEQTSGRTATYYAYFHGSDDSSLDSSLLEAFWKSREYLSLLKVVEHLAPVNEEAIQKAKDSIQDIFGDVSDGNIYSVRGGVELQISVEEESAAYWPAERPRYE